MYHILRQCCTDFVYILKSFFPIHLLPALVVEESINGACNMNITIAQVVKHLKHERGTQQMVYMRCCRERTRWGKVRINAVGHTCGVFTVNVIVVRPAANAK